MKTPNFSFLLLLAQKHPEYNVALYLNKFNLCITILKNGVNNKENEYANIKVCIYLYIY